MEIFGVPLTFETAKAFAGVGTIFGLAGAIAAKTHTAYYTRQGVFLDQVVYEVYGMVRGKLRVVSWDDVREINQVFKGNGLVKKVRVGALRASRKSGNGFLQLPGDWQRRMMGDIEDSLTGTNFSALLALMRGDEPDDQEIVFCPTCVRSDNDEEDTLIRIVLIHPSLLERFKDDKFANHAAGKELVEKDRFCDRVPLLHKIACNRDLPIQKDSRTAYIWTAEAETS